MNGWLWIGITALSAIAGSVALGAGQPVAPKAPPAATSEALDLFEREVRPVLVAECESCHGSKLQQGGLRLTDRAALMLGGGKGAAIVPGDPAKSLLLRAIRHEGLKMPPGKKLPARQIAAIERWIQVGAPWPATSTAKAIVLGDQVRIFKEAKAHWAYQPVRRPALPAVKNAAWVRNPIDAFVLARLEKAGLTPSPAADRRTLLRRVYYDLIGLPPTAEETEAFLADASPEAYEKVVDRLLASPQYGERWGRHWLDVARYADTKDGVLMYGDSRIRPYAYTYRDYVIRALNDDTPYDQFLREQLAADQIAPKVEPWRLAAMGFLTLGRQFDSNIHDVIDDRIDTVSRGMLGLTVACARCHDHKYDAVPTADYYALYGVFASSEAPVDLPLIDKPENTPGYVEYEKQFTPQRKQLESLVNTQYDVLIETARQRAGDYLVHIATTPPDPLEGAIFFFSLQPEELRPTMIARWRKLLERRATPTDPVFGPWKELMDLAPAEFGTRAPAVLEARKSRKPGTAGGEVNPLVLEALLAAKPADRAGVAGAYAALLKRLYEETKAPNAPAPTAEKKQLLDLVISRDSPGYFPKTQIWNFLNRTEKDQYGGITNGLDILAVQNAGAPARAMVLFDTPEPYEPRIFVRGSPSAPGDATPRQFLKILSGPNRQPFTHGSGRLDLANAIASPSNPLTARVLVNRVWMHHLGEPLVSSPSDFGSRSSAPTNPELLDWLAYTFSANPKSVVQSPRGGQAVRSAGSAIPHSAFRIPRSPGLGWSQKNLHRLIVLSNTYRQASADRPAARVKDLENKLLWRAHRRRLDFEQMRDTLLAVSGRLDSKMFGRPVREALENDSRRRSVYCLVDRQSLPEVFRAFNFAQPDQSVERRPSTTVPQQALFALNAPFVIEQAKALAARPEVAGAPTAAAKVGALYRILLGRSPAAEEVAAGVAFVERPSVVPAASEIKAPLSQWEQYAQVLLQMNEAMFLD